MAMVLKHMNILEIVCHDGFIVRDGVRGGTSGAIYRFWHMGYDYYDDIAQGINYQRWFQLKIFKKLCNNNIETKKI